jgi:predicted ferric reductase
VSWSDADWLVARAGGLTAFALISASVVVGLLLGLRARSPAWPRFLTTEVHRYLTLLALSFAGLHVLALWLDPLAGLRWTEMVVPFLSDWRPLPVALGIVALDLALAVWITTLLRARIGYRRWRRLHTLAFVVYGAALLHGLLVGTDTGRLWTTAIYAVSAAAVVALVLLRLSRLTGGARGSPQNAV